MSLLKKETRDKVKTVMAIFIVVGFAVILKSIPEMLILKKKPIKGFSGSLNSYHFGDLDSGYDYMIYLNELNEGFQITASLVDYFRKGAFESLEENELLYIEYFEMPSIFGEKRNVLVGISSLNRVFLSSDDSLKILNEENTLEIVGSLICFGVSIFLRRVLKKDREEQLFEMRHIS